MMNLFDIDDISIEDIQSTEYDLAMVASGYEQRCTYASSLLDRTRARDVLLLGFQERAQVEQRRINDAEFARIWRTAPTVLESSDDSAVLDRFRRIDEAKGCCVRILIDYSSMSRLWYAAVLNWAKRSSSWHRIEIDFLYSVGGYVENLAPMVIKDVLAVPGFEGRIGRRQRSLIVVGLGFDGFATLCVLDRLEADSVYSFYADPAAFPDYPRKVRDNNSEVMNHSAKICPVPLASVALTVRRLGELVAAHKDDVSVTLMPMGPKPQVLASLLLCTKVPGISCLRVSGERRRDSAVPASGVVVGTRVVFRHRGTRGSEA